MHKTFLSWQLPIRRSTLVPSLVIKGARHLVQLDQTTDTGINHSYITFLGKHWHWNHVAHVSDLANQMWWSTWKLIFPARGCATVSSHWNAKICATSEQAATLKYFCATKRHVQLCIINYVQWCEILTYLDNLNSISESRREINFNTFLYFTCNLYECRMCLAPNSTTS